MIGHRRDHGPSCYICNGRAGGRREFDHLIAFGLLILLFVSLCVWYGWMGQGS